MIRINPHNLLNHLDKDTHKTISNAVRRKKLVYLAVPYTHYDEDVRHERFRLVTEVSGILAALRVSNLSPITQSHVQSMFVEIGTTWEVWKLIDTIFLNNCDELWVLTLPGWQESVGVQAEIKIAKRLKLPVRFIDYDEETNQIQVSDTPQITFEV